MRRRAFRSQRSKKIPSAEAAGFGPKGRGQLDSGIIAQHWVERRVAGVPDGGVGRSPARRLGRSAPLAQGLSSSEPPDLLYGPRDRPAWERGVELIGVQYSAW
jgi:hypothetical protein